MFSHHSGRWGICWSWLPRWCWGEAREVLFPGRGSAGKNETRRCVYKSTNTRRCTATQTPRGLRELIHNTFWNINCPQNIMQGGIMFASVMLHLLLGIKPLTELLCVILIPPLWSGSNLTWPVCREKHQSDQQDFSLREKCVIPELAYEVGILTSPPRRGCNLRLLDDHKECFPPAAFVVLASLECLGDRWWALVSLSAVFPVKEKSI